MPQALTLYRPFRGLKIGAADLKSRAVELWRAYPRQTLGFGLLGLAVAVAIGGAAHSMPELSTATAQTQAPPAPPPLLVRQLAPEQALQVNQEIPVTRGPNPVAPAFVFKGGSVARSQALQCLASAVYYEAGSQDVDGERAVAQVVLNRVRHPAFPASVCGVVYEGSTRPTGCQFTFTCDGSLYRQPDSEGWKRAYRVAEAALSGYVFAPVGYATHYHANYVVPYWASTLAKNAVVGAHIFYRWSGGWGQPAAFTKSYGGHEPQALVLRNAALAVEHVTVAQPGAVANAIAKIPGAEAIKLAPSMRGDKRVAVRFNLVARKASNEAAHEDYVKKFEASDNLRWSLSGDASAANEKPLGKADPAPASGGGSVTLAAQR
jgi:spore germination cell wall hydrolase CwlJ-like protein